MKKKWKITIGVVVVAVLIIAIKAIFGGGNDETVHFETASAQINTLTNEVTATGTIEPITQVEVGTQVSGVIEKLYVDYNSVVKKGQLLAELEKTTLQAQVTEANAALQSAMVEYDYQKKNYERYKELYENKFVSESDYESAYYQYKVSEANVSKSESDLRRLKTNLNYAYIYSPIDGVVLSRSVDEGQTVAASFNTPTLFTIANDLTKMQVIADVDEADIGQVKEGQKVMFTVDAFPDDEFEGVVTQVRLEPTESSNVVTYSVVVDAPNPDLKLMPGLTANIVVYTMEKNNILTIPVKSTRFTPDMALLKKMGEKPPVPDADNMPAMKGTMPQTGSGEESESNEKTVWVKDGDLIKMNVVKTGVDDGINVEILSGLKEGDEVIISMTAKVSQKNQNPAEEESAENPFMPKPPGKKSNQKK